MTDRRDGVVECILLNVRQMLEPNRGIHWLRACEVVRQAINGPFKGEELEDGRLVKLESHSGSRADSEGPLDWQRECCSCSCSHPHQEEGDITQPDIHVARMQSLVERNFDRSNYKNRFSMLSSNAYSTMIHNF